MRVQKTEIQRKCVFSNEYNYVAVDLNENAHSRANIRRVNGLYI